MFLTEIKKISYDQIEDFKDNANIFGKVYFPRLIMPLSIVVSNLVRFGVQLLLLICMIKCESLLYKGCEWLHFFHRSFGPCWLNGSHCFNTTSGCSCYVMVTWVGLATEPLLSAWWMTVYVLWMVSFWRIL